MLDFTNLVVRIDQVSWGQIGNSKKNWLSIYRVSATENVETYETHSDLKKKKKDESCLHQFFETLLFGHLRILIFNFVHRICLCYVYWHVGLVLIWYSGAGNWGWGERTGSRICRFWSSRLCWRQELTTRHKFHWKQNLNLIFPCLQLLKGSKPAKGQ